MCVLFLLLLLTATSALCQDVKVAGQSLSSQDSIKVLVSEGCVAQVDAADGTTGGKELSLSTSAPLVLTHQIRLVPSGSGPGSCGCEGDLSALRARVERLEREVSALREKCGDPENPGCCSSRESKGPGCSISPDSSLCPNDCSDQGRCVDGRCQCFPGFSGVDCAKEECPVDCGQRGRCVDGVCQCDPGFSGPDCSQSSCPGNCNNRGRCVDGKCVCNSGFGGENCANETCPGNCNNRGRCVDGKCVCESGFGGENCTDKTCPGNCNNRGRCVDGKCQCNPGFGGENCADKTCPRKCNNRGRCVDGKCVCNSGFGGENCADKTCPGNCNNRGHCVEGKCVCNSGFGGENCADKSCPGNCNNRGRCVNGKCVCESGFGGLDCGSKTCLDNCSGRGVCVDGKCVCDSGFGGENCADKTCPGNCNNRGRCVDGKCVCDSGFKGVQCAEKACPNECSGRGKCVDGRCVCEGGFTGADCSVKGCPGNCNNRGRCVKGKCVCRKGFTGADCGQCQEGLTGPNCDTVMSAVEELQTKDLTQSSVTVVWTQPLVQYESYLLIFTSQKDGAEVKVEVPGSDSSFTQSGLAPGQSYSVTVTGQTGQSRGAPNTAHFNTLPSGPSNLRVVKTSTSSAVVQWDPSPSDVDRYRLTVSRSDGTGRGQELTFDPGASSAHITQLEAGLRYDITLVAEKGRSQSEPVTTHTTPGPEPPSDLVFDHVTEDSVTVSWTKPKSKVSGFKVTYTHKEEGEPFSVSLDQGNSSIDLTRLSPGSTYEVSVLSVLGLDESDSISRTFHTLPDPPTDLRAVNVTDSGALLLWRPALATVEKYTIVYGSGTDSEVRVTVSGNTAEEQLKGLQPSTTYTVTISSELDTRKSKETSTSFTTTASGPDGTGDLRATNVMPRTATLSWKPPSKPVTGYKLIYETEGQKKEVLVAPRVTQLNLTKLFPGAEYSVQLQAQGGGGEVLLTTFTTGSLRFPFPSDCSQEQLNGLRVSGLVDIFPLGRQGAELSVWCDMETDGGGWTVFQRRKDGSVNFFRTWKDYVHGFGDPTGEFWLGLETLHTLTTRGRMTLRVDLRDRQDSVFAQYSTFEVAKKNYRLTVAGYSGTAGDSMSYHNNRIFSTKDRDPASLITRCAMSYRGGWWYKNCHEANLNGLYGITSKHQGIIWTSWKGKEASIPFTEMKMRPTDFLPNKNNYRA